MVHKNHQGGGGGGTGGCSNWTSARRNATLRIRCELGRIWPSGVKGIGATRLKGGGGGELKGYRTALGGDEEALINNRGMLGCDREVTKSDA